ncbi:MAG: PAS domain S-box protein [Verrucomicrobia bacterium]|nr:PAS domain S-box protein [Verrucomicrobiota bacterium]
MSTPRILIVEDEAIVALDIRRQLTALGYEPLATTARGEEAVALAGQLQPDLVLMDIHLAGQLDGIAAAQAIRQQSGLPVVFLTAFADADTLSRAKLAEPFGYLVKPFSELDLRTAIEMALHRHQTELRLRQSHEEQAAILRTAMDGFCLLDREGRFLEVNEAFCRLTGYERSVLLGRTLAELDPQGAPTDATALLDRFRQSGAPGCEWRLTRHDGQPVDVELSVNWLPHAGGRWFCFARDITERKRTLEWLSLQSAALEAAANAIVITDPTGAILWVNAAFSATTGFGLDEVRGRNPRDLVRSGRQDQAFYRALWDTILAGQQWQGEIVNQRKDGSLYPAELSITPLRNTRGHITHFIAIQQDITRRKELEARFRQAQKMQAFGQLAGGVAHDFNNLLSVILMHTGLLRAAPDLSATQTEELAQIAAAAERAANLTRRLLTFSRRTTLCLEPLDLNEIVTAMSQMLRRLIGETIELRTLLLPGGAPTHGDRSLLEQVLLNLVINARDAMPQGGQLTLELRERTLEVDAVLPPACAPDASCASASATPATASPPSICRASSSPSSPPNPPARVPASASPPCTASSSNTTAGSRSIATSARALPSTSTCPASPPHPLPSPLAPRRNHAPPRRRYRNDPRGRGRTRPPLRYLAHPQARRLPRARSRRRPARPRPVATTRRRRGPAPDRSRHVRRTVRPTARRATPTRAAPPQSALYERAFRRSRRSRPRPPGRRELPAETVRLRPPPRHPARLPRRPARRCPAGSLTRRIPRLA